MVVPGTYGGFGWDGPTVDAWLRTFLDSRRGSKKLDQLVAVDASQRHLVIVLDSFSEAGVGIPLALTYATSAEPPSTSCRRSMCRNR